MPEGGIPISGHSAEKTRGEKTAYYILGRGIFKYREG